MYKLENEHGDGIIIAVTIAIDYSSNRSAYWLQGR